MGATAALLSCDNDHPDGGALYAAVRQPGPYTDDQQGRDDIIGGTDADWFSSRSLALGQNTISADTLEPEVLYYYGIYADGIDPEVPQEYLGIFTDASMERFSFARASDGWGVDNANVMRKSLADVPVFPGGAWDGVWQNADSCEGLLIEGASTNSIPQSEKFEAAWWSLGSNTFDPASDPGPDTLGNAWKITAGPGDTRIARGQATGFAGVGTYSEWVKGVPARYPGTRYVRAEYNTAVKGEANLQVDLVWRYNEWYISSNQVNGVTVQWYEPEFAAMFLSHMQYENRLFATSYIQTDGAWVARPASRVEQTVELLPLNPIRNEMSGQIVVKLLGSLADLVTEGATALLAIGNSNSDEFLIYLAGTDQVSVRMTIGGTHYIATANHINVPLHGNLDVRWRLYDNLLECWIDQSFGAAVAVPDVPAGLLDVVIGQQTSGANASYFKLQKLRLHNAAESILTIVGWD